MVTGSDKITSPGSNNFLAMTPKPLPVTVSILVIIMLLKCKYHEITITIDGALSQLNIEIDTRSLSFTKN